MEFITVNKENLEQEHICCSIADKKGETGVSSKKAWLRERFDEGLVFRKLKERGKVFIEYIPAEYAWCPIEAENYMYINCLWVSGKYKGQGISSILLDSCIEDALAKGKSGLTILTSTKKRSYMADSSFLRYKGFVEVDHASPYFLLYYLPFHKDAPRPKFREHVLDGSIKEDGLVLYYTNQCPFTEKYVSLIMKVAKDYGTELKIHKITTTKDAQGAPTPFTTYSFYYQHAFVTHENMSEKKFEKFLIEHGFSKV